MEEQGPYTWDEANKQFEENPEKAKADERHYMDDVRATVLRHMNDFAASHKLTTQAAVPLVGNVSHTMVTIHIGTTWADWTKLAEKIADVIK